VGLVLLGAVTLLLMGWLLPVLTPRHTQRAMPSALLSEPVPVPPAPRLQVAPAQELPQSGWPMLDLHRQVDQGQDALVAGAQALSVGRSQELRGAVHLVPDHQHLLVEREGELFVLVDIGHGSP